MDLGAAGTEGFGRDVHHLAAHFYADDGILTPTCIARLHQYFYALTELFDRMGLRTNVAKMVSMACHNFRTLGGHSTED